MSYEYNVLKNFSNIPNTSELRISILKNIELLNKYIKHSKDIKNALEHRLKTIRIKLYENKLNKLLHKTNITYDIIKSVLDEPININKEYIELHRKIRAIQMFQFSYKQDISLLYHILFTFL